MKSLYSAQHVTARSRCTVGSHKAHVIYRHEMFRLDKKREAKTFFFTRSPPFTEVVYEFSLRMLLLF